MQTDFFLHLGETLKFQVQILDPDNQPIDLDTHTVQFAAALELDTETIETLTSANASQISTIDANLAIVEVNFQPVANNGYDDRNLVFQMRTIDNQDVTSVILEGRIFMQPSLFD